jgi:branched-chain amino acid transport system substrate-binding protein
VAIKSRIAVVALCGAALCAVWATRAVAPPARAAEPEPIRFLFLAQQTGPNGSIGESMRAGIQVALDAINAAGGVAGGHKLVMDLQDDQGSNATAVQLVRTAAANGEKIVVGMWSSPICLAVAPVVDQLGGVSIGSTCSVDQLVGTKRVAKSFFGVAAHNDQMTTTVATVVHRQVPKVSIIDVVGYDYVTSHQEFGEVVDKLDKLGQKMTVRNQYFVPLSSVEFSSQVAALARSVSAPQPDALLTLFTYGAGTLGFLKQQAPFDIVGKYPMTITAGGYYEPAATLGGTAPPVWNVYDYVWSASDSDENRHFVSSYRKIVKSGMLPGSWAEEGYVSIKLLAAAIDKAGSADPAAVAKALEGLTIKTLLGEATMEADTHLLHAPTVAFLSVGDKTAPDTLRIEKYFVVDPYTSTILREGGLPTWKP